METVLNVGLTSKTVKALIKKSGDERFVYDSYRRLIMMYSDVVMEKGLGLGKKAGIRKKMEEMLEKMKQANGYKNDAEVSSESWQVLIEQYLETTKKHFGVEFPDSHHDQLYGAIEAVFASWNGKRAKEYRAFEKISDKTGTAVNVQNNGFWEPEQKQWNRGCFYKKSFERPGLFLWRVAPKRTRRRRCGWNQNPSTNFC